MVARQQSLQIDHVPSRLNAIRPNKPRLVRHRITSLYSEMNHECTQTANSFTRSKVVHPVSQSVRNISRSHSVLDRPLSRTMTVELWSDHSTHRKRAHPI